jgi:DNA invertase Pin-like site-specific DNA recombinase
MDKKAILLVRVSSLEQDYQAQIYDLKQYGISLGYTTFHIIETKETAFADFNQKIGTNDMFKFIEENPEYNTILLTEISRLARRQSILHQIKEHCLNKRIQIHIKDLDFRLLDDNGKVNQQGEIVFTLFGLFAESEVKQKLDRFTRKRKELMQMGVSISGKLLFGYDRFLLDNNKNTLVVNDEQATIIRTIFNWYLNGLNNLKNPSIKLISLECVKFGYHPYTHSKRNVNKLLKEQGYTGEKITNNKRKNPKFGIVSNESEYLVSSSKIKYPVIIELDIFNKVQEKLKLNITQGDKETKHITLLAKVLECPSCGRKMQGNYRKSTTGNKNSYRCTSRGDTESCSSVGKSISMNLIDSAVWCLIKADLPTLSKKINEINPDSYLLEMDNHLINLINREKEIQTSIEENITILNSIAKLTSPNIIELIKSTGKKIENLEYDLSKIEQEKSKIELNKLMIFDKQENVEAVINDNLATIEASKELLKKYINIFIHSIKIIEHNVLYTILELTLKDYNYLNLDLNVEKDFTVPKNSEFLVIDKTVTRNIKAAYYKSYAASFGHFAANIYTNDELFSILKDEIKLNKFNAGTELNFKKLSV